ncbi:FAD-binding and (Fe-S)-binding domain-containing protein [uncultured Bilophila sp.]|uniref:FAD-binding and (Fe-S)-binding domain-containing protein n=1 Tax=uncultured Bilophila sp. TaxID=529385 RepID=UPI0026175DB4|nr:FAD-binding and (Fe-S)-binding domain-containing protein [uncultured Bilophila sp.]
MPHKGPHISIAPDFVVNRILRINLEDFAEWPESVRRLAIEIAEELFLAAYNPFVDPATVKASVKERFDREVFALAHHYANTIGEGITLFWSGYEAEAAFRKELVQRLGAFLPPDAIVTRPSALVACATDATDLRMELPLMVVEPANAEQISELVKLANELKFALIPRGGASGLTGGSVPMRRRSVIVRTTRFTKISSVDRDNMCVSLDAGVITQTAIDAVSREGFLFTVDPASKTASTIGGNVAENSGGPFAFEYGTTLDNLLSWRMVTPTGEIITIERKDHPRHKILPEEVAVFEVKDLSGGVRSVVELHGSEIRLPGLGKDVTNKALGGLPGMQKEGVDGIITDATFIVHKKPAHSRVMVLEFYGRSMHQAAVVIGQIVGLRDRIRQDGDYARLSALEEFNAKYVRAIDYQKKSSKYEGLPISVIILQVDGDEPYLLEKCVQEISAIVDAEENVDLFLARDEKEAELFWEDRHRLSAIARGTSGFKINEDVVIPMQRIPDFALFLEQLNLECAAMAYRKALQELGRLPGMALEDRDLNREFVNVTRVAQGGVPSSELSDEEMEARAVEFLRLMAERYDRLASKIKKISDDMLAGRVVVASHMHAGDGNCHVNIPVNSNDLHMLEIAEEAAMRVMAEAQEMGGAVSGEHGIGITKIAFLGKDKMDAIREFKQRVDPRDVFNPAKLTQRELPVRPFTFSFNRLIEDISQSGLPDKERLIHLLASVQMCTRCGKCKQVCPMMYPECSYHFHPRNKNMVLGAIIEAIYYSQINKGKPDPSILAELRAMMEHCTGCGRCTSVCPVKIPSADVALQLRAFLEEEGAGGHPLKTRVLDWLVKDPSHRIPQAVKAAAFGQRMQNRIIGVVPHPIRKRLYNPLFSDKGPEPGYRNLYEALHLERGNVFLAAHHAAAPENSELREAVLYFPGCGGSLLSRSIGLSALGLLLRTGVAVILPESHLCCGYPLLSSGADGQFAENMAKNRERLSECLRKATQQGFRVTHIITACGSCREGIERLEPASLMGEGTELVHLDVMQFVQERLQGNPELFKGKVLYHASCHPEWVGVHKVKGIKKQSAAIAKLSGAVVEVSPGCCGESGMGAIASPLVYNTLRKRKMGLLAEALEDYPAQTPVLVGCPSCKVGITRSLMGLHSRRPVLHTVEWIATLLFREKWGEKWIRVFRRRIAPRADAQGVRTVDFDE